MAALILVQPSPQSLDAVTAALTESFSAVRAALADERPVVVVLDDRDLLGQGDVVDAALASGLLGMVRALALEGVKPGWRLNAVTHRGDPDGEDVARTVAWLAESGLSGQLLRVGTAHLGKVQP